MELTILRWFKRGDFKNEPRVNDRILIFCPEYPKGHEMRVRFIDSQFWGICQDATHWANPIEPEYNL